MARKRSVFDIDFDPDAGDSTAGPDAALQGAALVPSSDRRGPMASAITETAEASHERARAEAAIRSENDALAHEYVRLKKLGLITDLIAVQDVLTTKLVRDRSPARDAELDELKTSIRDVGLSNPIRVEQTEGGYELIQGFRRLSAFRELLAETGDTRYSRIPAALVPRGEPLIDLYRKMVDENLVRRDVSFGEMAMLALSYAEAMEIKADDAVSILYASALKQKRAYIRTFARVIVAAQGLLRFPEAMPRALGLDLARVFERDGGMADSLIQRLEAAPFRDADTELAILRSHVAAAPQTGPKTRSRSSAKTSLKLARAEGEARVIASDGKVEMRLNRDFASVSRARLQAAVEAFLNTLDES